MYKQKFIYHFYLHYTIASKVSNSSTTQGLYFLPGLNSGKLACCYK